MAQGCSNISRFRVVAPSLGHNCTNVAPQWLAWTMGIHDTQRMGVAIQCSIQTTLPTHRSWVGLIQASPFPKPGTLFILFHQGRRTGGRPRMHKWRSPHCTKCMSKLPFFGHTFHHVRFLMIALPVKVTMQYPHCPSPPCFLFWARIFVLHTLSYRGGSKL